MPQYSNTKKPYHHGNLAESLLNAVDELATKFGFEAVTLRGCAKLVGVSPSSAFRHYVDKRALLTAFATRALRQLSTAMAAAKEQAASDGTDAFLAVGLAYVEFAVEKPAFFRAMWREEAIYANDENYLAAAGELIMHLRGGFADTIDDEDPASLSPQELLAWSSVHGLANLLVDGPVAKGQSNDKKLERATAMMRALAPALGRESR
ncbi:MAG: TetR/AcrR family transcriptional regulator [Gammaproteobacteria bacterium]|nr:TetR/AcrR family transcriptional regulator [Gammaproteobacteria bacterium]